MAQIPTTFLILSDTHGESMSNLVALPPVDVAIHCGDLTEESKLTEFNSALDLLRSIKAGLKLVIAGNHDLSMDVPRFEEKIRDALGVTVSNGEAEGEGEGMGSAATASASASVCASPGETLPATPAAAAAEGAAPPALVPALTAAAPPSNISLDEIYRTFGYPDQVPSLFNHVRNEGIILLPEGIHDFRLANGAFQYPTSQGHTFHIKKSDDIDVVITHGPPHGILDRTAGDKLRAGCPHLFEAVERTRPRLHCFGHIHEGWGAKMVTWRESSSNVGEKEREREKASHFTAIDNEHSFLVESLATLKPGKWNSPEVIAEKSKKLEGYKRKGYCGRSFSMSPPSLSMAMATTAGTFSPITSGYNMAEMDGDGDMSLPNAMDIDLEDPQATVNGGLSEQIETNQMDGDGDIRNGEANQDNKQEQGTPLEKGKQTLFVNAAIQGLDEEDGQQLPWIVTINLPEAPHDD